MVEGVQQGPVLVGTFFIVDQSASKVHKQIYDACQAQH